MVLLLNIFQGSKEQGSKEIPAITSVVRFSVCWGAMNGTDSVVDVWWKDLQLMAVFFRKLGGRVLISGCFDPELLGWYLD